MKVPPGLSAAMAVEDLKKNESASIEFAEPDFSVEPSFVPNDPWFVNWEKDKQQVNTPLAWDNATGGGLSIAIVDSGVNCSHEDLSSQCVAGWNFYNNNSNTTDVSGHGTAVAGVAAALGNNGVGIAGVAIQAKIMPLRVSAIDGTATYSALASAITYAADHGVRVVNVSYQAGGSSTVESAANYLKSRGGLLVVSEGNYSSDTGYTNSPNIISVSGVDSNDGIYSWSSFGSDVDVSAPGCTGATTNLSGAYGSFCGTSNAAPEVAGVLALIWSANQSLSPDQATDLLFKSSKDLGTSGWDKYYGWGRIDAAGAVSLALGITSAGAPTTPTTTTPSPTPTIVPPAVVTDSTSPVVVIASPQNGAKLSTSGINTVAGVATDNLGTITKMEIYIDGVLKLSNTFSSKVSYRWNYKKVPAGAHTINIRAYDASGNVGQATATVYK
jgi:subtilisin family serine protease